MTYIRLFYKEKLSDNLISNLDKSQSHYISKVMRIKEGQNFSLFNQSGEFEAKVENIIKGIVEFSVEKKLRSADNPTEGGLGRSWPTNFPIRFADVRGDLIADLQYNVTYGGTSYIPFPVNISSLDQGSDGKINELTLSVFNVDNIRERLPFKNCSLTDACYGLRSYERGVAQLGSAGALGALGRRFESCRPDSIKSKSYKRVTQTRFFIICCLILRKGS